MYIGFMEQKRRINTELLAELVVEKGSGSLEKGIAIVAAESDLKLNTIRQWCKGWYRSEPGTLLRKEASRYFQRTEDELFPKAA